MAARTHRGFAGLIILMPSFSLRGFSKMPRARIFEARLGDNERQWLTRIEQNRVFFRAADDKKAPIFSLARPFKEELAHLEQWFQHELNTGRVRRFETRVVDLRRGEPTLAQFLFDHDDSGEVREWFDSNWTPFSKLSWELRPHARVWHDDWIMMSPERAVKRAQNALLARPFDKTKVPEVVANWNGSSLRELTRVVEALSHIFWQNQADTTLWRTINGMPVYARAGAVSTVFCHSPSSILSRRGTSWPSWMPSKWRELLTPFLARDGLEWKRNTAFPADVRAGWEVFVPTLGFSPEHAPDISMHEKLESVLFLREWLQDKVAKEQIETLLQT